MNCLQLFFLFCILGIHVTVAAEEFIYAQIGDDVELNIHSEPKKYYKWFFGGEEIAWVNPSGGKKVYPKWMNRLTLNPITNTLVIKNITQSDFALFRCTVKGTINTIAEHSFRLVQLNVAVDKPVLLPGELLTLSCSVTNQERSPQIYWLNPQGQKMEPVGGRVMVQAAALHSGHWTIVVSDGKTEKRGRVKVTIIDLLPLAPVQTLYTSTTSPLTIPCSLSANTSWEEVKSKGIVEVGWNFCPPNLQCDKSSLLSLSLENKPTWKTPTDVTLRPSLNPSKGNLSLTRNLGRAADAGDYECFMKFENGVSLTRAMRVEVLQITSSPGTELSEGQQLNLTCATGHPLPPDIQVQWFPPNKASSLSPTPSVPLHLSSSHINIPAVGRAEDGKWRCELRRGEMLLTSAVVELKIEAIIKISEWMLVTLCAAAAILILLVVLIVIVRRRRQRRTRRHKRLCQCKNPKPKGFYRS